MLLRNIKNISIAEAIEISKRGLFFKIQDGKIKGFTK